MLGSFFIDYRYIVYATKSSIKYINDYNYEVMFYSLDKCIKYGM